MATKRAKSKAKKSAAKPAKRQAQPKPRRSAVATSSVDGSMPLIRAAFAKRLRG